MDVKLTKKLKNQYVDFLVYISPGHFSLNFWEKPMEMLSMPNIRRSPLLSIFQFRFRSFFHLLISGKDQPNSAVTDA
jgi:hypothetical protein